LPFREGETSLNAMDKRSDIWANCERSDLMLDLVNDWMVEFLQKPYPHYEETIENCSEGLEQCIDSLTEMIKGTCDQERERARSENFSYKRAVDHFRKEVDSGRLGALEGASRRFRHLLFVARKASHYILSDELGRFQFHKLSDDIIGDETGSADGDESELKLTIMKQQADLLRASVGNPFNDFDH